MSLRRLGSILRRRFWLVLAGTLGVLAGVAAFTHYAARAYESSATILVESRGRNADVPALAALERLGRGSNLETELELVQSRAVVEPVVEALHLQVTAEDSRGLVLPVTSLKRLAAGRDLLPGEYYLTYETDAGGIPRYTVRDADGGALVLGAPSDSQVAFAGLQLALPADPVSAPRIIRVVAFPRAVAETQKRIAASQAHRDADLIGLTCTGESAMAAQQLCEAVSEHYVHLRADKQRTAATQTAAFLRTQVTRVGAQLAEAEDSLEAFNRRHMVVALSEQASAEVRNFAELTAQRDQLEMERATLADLIGAAGTGSEKYQDLAGFPTLMKNSAVASLNESLVALENRRSDLSVRRTGRNAELSALDARIGAIQQQLRSIATRYEQALSAQVRSLDKTLEQASRQMAVLPTWQVDAARLERQRALRDELYRTLATHLREAEVAEAVDVPTVAIADVASLPLAPAWPNRRLNFGLGIVLGLAFGIALALYRERTDARIYGQQQLGLETEIPLLGIVPRVRGPGPLLPFMRLHDWVPGETINTAATQQLRVSNGTEELALEAFRSLGADLNFAGQQLLGNPLKSVVVTSAGPGEGKTFIACNLALARVSHGVRTLLIDADMRAGSVGSFFGIAADSQGLSDLLADGADLDDVWRAFKVDGRDALWVIPAGGQTLNAAGLLEGEGFRNLLDEAESKFDLVILDAPPLNLITDTATLAATADTVLVVVRGGVTDRNALQFTLERLRRAGGSVAGVVLNGVTLSDRSVAYSGKRK